MTFRTAIPPAIGRNADVDLAGVGAGLDPLRAVEGLQTPVMERYDSPHHLLVFDPVTGREPVEWSDYSAESGAGVGVTCRGCGSHVRKSFVRVFAPEGASRPRCCPNCEDLIREGDGTIRKKRSGHAGRRA